MSAAITAIGLAAAATLYSAEQQRVAQSKADDKAGDEMKRIQAEQEWQKKKKGINDQNAALAALRLRGGDPAAPGTNTTGVTPAGQTPPIGILGGTAPTAGVNDKLNSPLGL